MEVLIPEKEYLNYHQCETKSHVGHLTMKKYHKIQIRTNELLSRGSSKDLQSRLVDIFLFVLILLNVTAVCLESVKSIRDSFVYEFFIFETMSVVIFSIESYIS